MTSHSRSRSNDEGSVRMVQSVISNSYACMVVLPRAAWETMIGRPSRRKGFGRVILWAECGCRGRRAALLQGRKKTMIAVRKNSMEQGYDDIFGKDVAARAA